MNEIGDLYGRVRAISDVVADHVRSVDPDRAGWGQFVEPSSRVLQIGPYGTAAAILLRQIAYPDTPVSEPVCAQLQAFWVERPNGKLFRQNVRLAFTVLALGNSRQSSLVALREEVAAELRGRQLPDGSWSDAPVQAAGADFGRVDATAWAVLALQRSGMFKSSAESGARWLGSRIEGSGDVQLLSLLATAAATLCHPDPKSVSGLRARGFKLLSENTFKKEELISFFDYEMISDGQLTPMRDYLCFPAFYPLSILLSALTKDAGFVESIHLSVYRMEAISRLAEFPGGTTYKLPAARYSSMVDQALFALSYEHLAQAEAHLTKAVGRFTPLYKWTQKSLLINLVLPLLFIGGAAATLAEPATIPQALKQGLGLNVGWLVDLATAHKSEVQLVAALLIPVVPHLPKKGLALFRDRFLRR